MNRFGMRTAILSLLCLVPMEAAALITGGTGNTPLRDPGWPKGAAEIFNHTGRVAWWEGPPFGGGQWHSECRGDAKALSAVLASFAKIDSKIKRVVIHDGTGTSFWLAPNREKDKLASAKIDWMFSVWFPANWERLRKMPADINPTKSKDATPPAQIDVYTADLKWADVTVPEGLEIHDHRLEAHGFAKADGIVFEGKVLNVSNQKPIEAAVRVERIEAQQTGGYRYTLTKEVKADAQGKWVIKGAPSGWLRIVVDAPGYAPRVAGHAQLQEEPTWNSFDCELAAKANAAGRVVDEEGKPIAGVDVSLGDVVSSSGERYAGPNDYSTKTDADGRFHFDVVPAGKARVWTWKNGYTQGGLGPTVTTPTAEVNLVLRKAGDVIVTVDFSDTKRPEGYIVSMEPEGGSKVGSYGGSGNIDGEGKMSFKNVPAGVYFVSGRPNPGGESQTTDLTKVTVTGGQKVEVTIKAK